MVDILLKNIHPALVLRPGCIPQKVGVNKKGYCHQKYGVSVIGLMQTQGAKLNMRERKLRSGVN